MYTGVAVVIAFVLAFPLGVLIGHTGRASFLAINAGNAGRALPTLGVLMLGRGTGRGRPDPGHGRAGDPGDPADPDLDVRRRPARSTPATVDASRGVGMTEYQIATRVEIPEALPIIFGGIRNATLQVVSTATIAAYVGLGGLGRYLFDGLALRDYPRVVAGAVLVAVLAVVLDLLLAALQRRLVSPGVDGRAERGPRRTAARPVTAHTNER